MVAARAVVVMAEATAAATVEGATEVATEVAGTVVEGKAEEKGAGAMVGEGRVVGRFEAHSCHIRGIQASNNC